MQKTLRSAVLAVLWLLMGVSAAASGAHYRQIARFTLEGDGGWDYVVFDPAAKRLFIAHNQQILVVDPESGKRMGEIPADGAHGIALVPEHNRGFSSNGRAGTVTVFDLKTLKVVQDIKAGENPDAIIYDAHTKRVLVMNGRSKDLMAIDPETLKVTATVALGAKPEFGAAGAGHVYVNLEDTGEMADIDSSRWQLLHRWKLTGCDEPSGLAADWKSGQLFSVCGNRRMVVVEAASGHIISTVATGDGTDGAAYDPGLNLAFASNGEGTLTVVRQGHGGYELAENVPTQRGARTIALDPATHRIFLVTAELGPPAEGQKRPSIKPGTFTLLVFGPEKSR